MSESNGAAPSPSAELHQNAIPNDQAVENAAEEVLEGLPQDEQPKETPAQAAARKKKFQVKTNGKAREVEVDLDNEEEIKRYIEKAYGADEKFQEAAMTRKQAEALIELLKTDPRKILSHPDLGIDVKALAHQIINEELEEMAKSPEQKRLEEMEKSLRIMRKMKRKLKKKNVKLNWKSLNWNNSNCWTIKLRQHFKVLRFLSRLMLLSVLLMQ